MIFVYSSGNRHRIFPLVSGVQACPLPIWLLCVLIGAIEKICERHVVELGGAIHPLRIFGTDQFGAGHEAPASISDRLACPKPTCGLRGGGGRHVYSDRKSTRLNSSPSCATPMPSSPRKQKTPPHPPHT